MMMMMVMMMIMMMMQDDDDDDDDDDAMITKCHHLNTCLINSTSIPPIHSTHLIPTYLLTLRALIHH
jgi:hypothetical protein